MRRKFDIKFRFSKWQPPPLYSGQFLRKKLRKKTHFNKNCFLNDSAKFLSNPISDLCNLSISSEKSSDYFKVAKFKPFCKISFLTLVSNYRPVIFNNSNIQSLEKTMELRF